MNAKNKVFSIFTIVIAGFLFLVIRPSGAQNLIMGWDPSENPNILRYRIYRSIHPDSSFRLLGSVPHPDSIYQDNNTQFNTHYYYVATALDKYGAESGFSNPIDTLLQSTVPVELSSFSAHKSENNSILLQWSTSSESSNYGFYIQRLGGVQTDQFITIGFVDGKGTTSDVSHYRFEDKNLAAGVYTYRLQQNDFDGTSKISDSVRISYSLPHTFCLHQNYPNPFNNATQISYQVPFACQVQLDIYDETGRHVCRLVDSFQSGGIHEIIWDAKDFRGRPVSSGLYYYRIQTASDAAFRKMTLIK